MMIENGQGAAGCGNVSFSTTSQFGDVKRCRYGGSLSDGFYDPGSRHKPPPSCTRIFIESNAACTLARAVSVYLSKSS